jgi:two-component system nitrogen regulation response regulator NtrX
MTDQSVTAAAERPVVLVLDDEKNIRRSIEIALEQEGMHVISAHDPAAASRTLRERIVDVLILDIRLGDIDGITFFRRLQSSGLSVPTIFISGHATLTEAAQAVKIGGYDFLEKPFSAEKISAVAHRCLEHAAIKQRLQRLEAQSGPLQLIGETPALRRVVADALKVAATQANVLITGESGTGKELAASTIHAHSSRSAAPFIKVNCSAIPEALVESELFGYERGAFTGAFQARRGLFEQAHRGVLFLDEVADLSLPAQAKMLRVLQNGEIQKIGAQHPVKVDVRIVAATHKDLRKCVADGSFREDLYYRLSTVPLKVPSLRERREDIPLLARFLIQRLCEKNNIREKPIDDDALWELKEYQWPGNVRELGNVLERALIMSGERISVMDLPEEIVAASDESPDRREGSTLRDFRDHTERDYIIATLRRNGGNISQSASELGVRRPYLHRRLSVLKIAKRDYFA